MVVVVGGLGLGVGVVVVVVVVVVAVVVVAIERELRFCPGLQVCTFFRPPASTIRSLCMGMCFPLERSFGAIMISISFKQLC